jgi:hypothetical protein
MTDPRCKIAAIEIDDPRGNGVFRGVTIEMEDLRCKSLINRVVIDVQDHRCNRTAIKMVDPRCKDLFRAW